MPKPNSKTSKWFRVAVEGATTDGREIQKNWIEEMAAQYNPETYGARINCEHIRTFMPSGDFGAYGDILAAKAEEVEIDGKTKLALFVQLSPTDGLIELNKAGQKIYTSIEVEPKFADTGKAYLMGLAITDSPASLGTEALSFSAKHGTFNNRKSTASTLFTAAELTELDFTEEQPSAIADLKAKFAALFTRVEKIQKDDSAKEFGVISDQFIQLFNQQLDSQDKYREQAEQLGEQITALKQQVDTLQEAFSSTDTEPSRPPVDGGDGQILAAY